MANSPQAKKRIRQNNKARANNTALKTRMRTAIKKVLATIKQGDHSIAMTALHHAQKLIDGMTSKGFIKKNTAARYVSRLNAKVKQLAS